MWRRGTVARERSRVCAVGVFSCVCLSLDLSLTNHPQMRMCFGDGKHFMQPTLPFAAAIAIYRCRTLSLFIAIFFVVVCHCRCRCRRWSLSLRLSLTLTLALAVAVITIAIDIDIDIATRYCLRLCLCLCYCNCHCPPPSPGAQVRSSYRGRPCRVQAAGLRLHPPARGAERRGLGGGRQHG